MARRIYTSIYSKSAVLEVREAVKVRERGEWKEYLGRTVIRAATLESGDNHKEITMSLSPSECYKLGIVIKQVAKSQQPVKKKVIIHNPEGNKYSEIIVEYWQNGDRKGFAVILQLRERVEDRDNILVRINVPIEKIEFLALGDFFQSLNTLLRWREVIKVEQQEPHEAPADEPVIDDDDLDDIEL